LHVSGDDLGKVFPVGDNLSDALAAGFPIVHTPGPFSLDVIPLVDANGGHGSVTDRVSD